MNGYLRKSNSVAVLGISWVRHRTGTSMILKGVTRSTLNDLSNEPLFVLLR